MSTVLDLITDSMLEIGALGTGETPTNEEAQQCLNRLNRMLNSWNTERLTIYTISIAAYNLVANQQTYTIGPGGFFNAPRPQKIEQANIILAGTDPPTRQPLSLFDDNMWSQIRVQNVPYTIPQALYNDGGFPLSTLYLWGYPTGESSSWNFIPGRRFRRSAIST